MCIYLTLLPQTGCDMSIFKLSTAGLNLVSSFSVCLTKAKEPSLPYYLHVAMRNKWIHTVPKLSEMLTVLSRIRTLVTNYIFFGNNCNAKDTSLHMFVFEGIICAQKTLDLISLSLSLSLSLSHTHTFWYFLYLSIFIYVIVLALLKYKSKWTKYTWR